MTALITEADIDEIALGAAVLGTGGGGDPHVGSLIAKRLIRMHGAVRMLTVDDVTDEDMFTAIAGRGVSVVVGDGSSGAAHRVRDHVEVRRLLELLGQRCLGAEGQRAAKA